MGGINIDRTAPVVSYSGNTGTYAVDQTVNITCTSADGLSGIASSTCQGIAGPAYIFPLGGSSYSATATDLAGNTGSGSVSFTVTVTPGSLSNPVARFVTKEGVVKSLQAKINAAEAARGNGNAKAGAVAAFLNEVQAQTGKALTAEQAAILIRLAQAL